MDQTLSLRRAVVPALLAGLSLCGTLGWSSVAAADGASARDARPVGQMVAASSGAAKAAAPVAVTRAQPAAAIRGAMPRATSTASQRSAVKTTYSSGAGRATPVHFAGGHAAAHSVPVGIAAAKGG